MDIRSSLEGLRSIFGAGQAALGAGQPSPASPQSKVGGAGSSAAFNDRATLSSAASQVSQSASEPDVRLDKVAGIQAQLAGDQQVAEQAFAAAKLRDGRSIPARYFLAEQYFRGGDAPSGLREIAVLARMVPNGVTNLAPYVAAYAKDPRNRTRLQSLFKSDPGLEQAALSALAADPGNSELILGLATPSATAPQWSGVLIPTLINAGQYDEAAEAFAQINVENDPSQPLFNWIIVQQGLALMMGGKDEEARTLFGKLEDAGMFSNEDDDKKVAKFFIALGHSLRTEDPIPADAAKDIDKWSYDALKLLFAGIKDWNLLSIEGIS